MLKILSDVAGYEIKINDINKEQQEKMFSMISSPGNRNFMESPQIQWSLLEMKNLNLKMN